MFWYISKYTSFPPPFGVHPKYKIKEKRHLYIINPNANPGYNDLPEWMIHKAELIEFLRNVQYQLQFTFV